MRMCAIWTERRRSADAAEDIRVPGSTPVRSTAVIYPTIYPQEREVRSQSRREKNSFEHLF